MIFTQNGAEFDFFDERKIPEWNVQTDLLLTSNDVMFKISHWKSIK